MRILVVEDERKVALAEMVATPGLKAERATQWTWPSPATTGWAMAESYNYDLIVLDLMLPGMAGEEVLRRIHGELSRCRC